MKKVVLVTVLFLGFISVQAQSTGFGLTAGYLNTNAKVSGGGISESIGAESGFYAGILVDISISDKFGVQPELLYANVNGGSALLLPVLAKFFISEQFYLEGGPQLTLDLESGDIPDYTKATLQLPLGLGIDITENFFAEARYALPISNAYTGDLDIKVQQNFLTVGVGYKF